MFLSGKRLLKLKRLGNHENFIRERFQNGYNSGEETRMVSNLVIRKLTWEHLKYWLESSRADHKDVAEQRGSSYSEVVFFLKNNELQEDNWEQSTRTWEW